MEGKSNYKWMVAANIREMVNKMNEAGIQQKKIVSLMFNEQYILVYSE